MSKRHARRISLSSPSISISTAMLLSWACFLTERNQPPEKHRLSVLAFGLLYERAALCATLTLRGVGTQCQHCRCKGSNEFPVAGGVGVVDDGLEDDASV